MTWSYASRGVVLPRHHDRSSPEPDLSFQYKANRLRVEPVLHAVEFREKGLIGIPRSDGDSFLQDDRSMIDVVIDKVDRDPGHFSTPRQRISDSMGARKRG